ncbi:MAG: hypothetical protein JSS66_05780 [Armatimonadetes bacterium]|nr:hypothetical protein [Armatimonadota bacterium]
MDTLSLIFDALSAKKATLGHLSHLTQNLGDNNQLQAFDALYDRFKSQDGSVQNPFFIDIPEEAWVPDGDFGNGEDPRSRLSLKLELSGLKFHVQAIEVVENTDPDSNEYGYLQATNPQLETDVSNLWAIAGWEGEHPDLLIVQGRQYLVTMFPFA